VTVLAVGILIGCYQLVGLLRLIHALCQSYA
jgi:hypothetical protein